MTFLNPLNKDVSNNVSIDLSAYAIKNNVDSSLNTINNSLSNKQNVLTFLNPLNKDVSNNVSIDLSAYAIKNNVDASLNSLNNNKQNNLTFSNPFLNTSNTISLKLNSSQFNIDSSGNLNLISNTSSQWTTSGSNIYYNTGNVGIGTTDPKALLHVRGKTIIDSTIGIAPANGVYGSDGTRLILWPGADNNVPYSLGIAGGTLWYAVPTNAIHAFYTGTTERLRIDSAGNLISTADIRGLNLVAGGTTFQLLIGPPSATAAAAIQTIQQGVGYNQNLSLQATGGNVGIGTTNPGTNKLYVNGTTFLNGNTTINTKLIVGNNNSFPDLQLGPNNGYNIGVATGAGSFSSSALAA